MRILWADDQPEVVKTLRPLLSPLKAQIIEARDGTEALRLVTDSDFDLILLDLHMPPDEWGGLWFLEQLAETGKSIPILVLSGEGQQRETIKALRLGIEDYVRKEEVERELIPRIQEVMTRDSEQLEVELLKGAPALVAVPLKRYLAEASAATKLHRLIELYEAILRLAAFLALAERRDAAPSGRGPDVDLSIGTVVSPTMGSWNRVRIATCKALPDTALAWRYHRALDSQLSDRVVKVRNDLAHGGEPSAVIAQELIDELDPGIRSVLSRLRRTELKLMIPGTMDFDGVDFAVQGVVAKGDSVAFPTTTLSSTVPLTAHRVYASDGDDRFIDTSPLILARSAREPGAWELSLFDGIRDARPNDANLKGTERLRYLNLWTGGRDVGPDATSTELRGLVPGW